MNTNNSFGQKIKKLRNKQGLTLKQLALKTGISDSFISYLENGLRNPSREVVLDLAEILLPINDSDAIDDLLISAKLLPINLENTSGKNLINIYEDMLNNNENDYKTYTLLIMTLLKSGKYELAKEKIQKGFVLFKDSVHLQSLLSQLELAQGNYEGAIVNMQAAIDNHKLKTAKQIAEINVKLADLILNMGIIYFIKGLSHSSNSFRLESENENSLADEEKLIATKNLKEAKRLFEEALDMEPSDVYLLDEYARVNFNLAYIGEDDQDYWQNAIDSYKKVINFDSNYELGKRQLLDACIFYAYSLIKKGNYEGGELFINVISICKHDYWLVLYIKACLYSLTFNSSNESSLLDKALKYLQIAADINDPGNRTKKEAALDPDLANLRLYKKEEFFSIIN